MNTNKLNHCVYVEVIDSESNVFYYLVNILESNAWLLTIILKIGKYSST